MIGKKDISFSLTAAHINEATDLWVSEWTGSGPKFTKEKEEIILFISC